MSKKDYSNIFVLKSLGLPCFSDIYQFSDITELSVQLVYNLSQRSDKQYKERKILKKSGEFRTIHIPNYSMKIVQKWILVNILEKLVPSSSATAFRKGSDYGIIQNAKIHQHAIFTIAIDLTNFFGTINSQRVYRLFKNIGYNKFAATLLTNLCTLNGVLPQGGVCSPAISNLICLNLDNRLEGLCGKRGIVYSRYADDMCFSADNKDLLKKTLPIIKKIVENEKFFINEKKTKYFGNRNRKIITGVVLSREGVKGLNKLRAPKDMKQKIRVLIHEAIVTGDYNGKSKILGMISYVDYVEKKARNTISYKEKIRDYIIHCSEKVKHYEEVVVAYNENLFYDLPKLEYFELDFNSMSTEEQNDCFEEYNLRGRYLQKIGCFDICKITRDYFKMINTRVIDYEEESPF